MNRWAKSCTRKWSDTGKDVQIGGVIQVKVYTGGRSHIGVKTGGDGYIGEGV